MDECADNMTICKYVCHLLLDNIEEKNLAANDGWTSLDYAAQDRHLQVCQLLFDNIEEKNPAANNGWTPLHSAAYNGHLQVFQLLINNIEEKNPAADGGCTLFFVYFVPL